jgi:PASTA domain-containing protein
VEDTQVIKPDDAWPEAETVVHAPPPSGPAPAEPPPSRGLGAGMLVALIAVLLLVGGFGVAWYFLHRDSSPAANTVTVTTAGVTTKHRAAASAPGAKKQATTVPTTTAAPPQPASSTVPDVTQQSEASAVQALSQAGILASLAFVPAHDELGTVEAQAKPAGTSVPFQSHMQVNVSTGPGQKERETVPSVIGQSLQDALTAINGAQLRLLYLRLPVTDASQAGKIVQQSPLGGGTAPRNAQVVVYLGALEQQ